MDHQQEYILMVANQSETTDDDKGITQQEGHS
jgi:hypothetical protein